MNLRDAIDHGKSMLRQNNNNGNSFTIVTEEDEVIQLGGTYSYGYGSANRTLSKMEVWSGPHGEQQIWGLLVVDSSGSSLSAAMWGGGLSITPSAGQDEIAIVFMDRMGNCRTLMARAVDSSWKKVENPEMFWTHEWAKAIHDVCHGISRPKPFSIHSEYGSYKVGDEVEVAQKGSSYSAKGKILSFLSYKNSYGHYDEPDALVGDANKKGVFHTVSVKEIFLSPMSSKPVDKNVEKEDTEGDRMMRFFASSQHDIKSPWFNGQKDKE